MKIFKSLKECETFEDEMCYIHRKLLFEDICEDWDACSYLADLVEAMTNINTPEKLQKFNEICSCE